MSVTAQNPTISHISNGSNPVFAYPFKVLAESNLKVYVDGVLTASGFSVSGIGNPSGGNVTFTVAPPNGAKVTLIRRIPLTRSTDYIEGGALAAQVLDDDFDNLVYMIQDIRADAASLVEFDSTIIAINASEAAAAAAVVSVNNTFNDFESKYLGAKAANPTLDNDGNGLVTGALYWNTSNNEMKVWTGSAWLTAYVTAGDFLARTGGVMNGDVEFSGNGRRITGDMSNATLTNRLAFQTSTVNGASVVGVVSNGTSTDAAISVFNASNPTNSSSGVLYSNATEIRLASDKSGSGTYLPMTFYTGGSERMRISTTGDVTLTTQAADTSNTTVATTGFVDRMRNVPVVATGGGGPADISIRGKCYSTTGSVTIPASVFSAGDTFSIYNNSASSVAITQGSGMTLRTAGEATTGTRNLLLRGLATVLFISATEAVVTGNLG